VLILRIVILFCVVAILCVCVFTHAYTHRVQGVIVTIFKALSISSCEWLQVGREVKVCVHGL